ncbi:hypothetical protein [Yersinia pekkanenii]|uniref:Uncharacterized protein n=1 Tax=Yersinia pekkanenii TaxID=1288385 RepID=A0A0T9NNQ8_9GAMM|nr:hypothetical protein [Yersinia pekkanenii]CNH22168.1 Uncharacterised protein [Yersinia pekkanenii]CRY65916.1 Uncharacterised protein [Yersinia pekkanenii]
MATKSFHFSQMADLRAEGVCSLHASFSLSINVTESGVKEGKKLYLSASLLCNAAKAYGSGKIIPWCTVKNNIDNKKYVLDGKGRSFALKHDDILIGECSFLIPIKKNTSPSLEIEAGYVLDTGYTGTIKPFPGKMSRRIVLNRFKDNLL